MGNRCHPCRHRPAVAFYRWFFMDVPGLLPPCRRVHTSVARDGTLSRPHLVNGIRQLLPEDFDVEKHFTPSYRPWQQRLALVPDGDLFKRESPRGRSLS